MQNDLLPEQAAGKGHDDLAIERVEVVMVQVPLSRTFSGSVYEVTHRTAIITRVYADGLVGEGINMVGETSILPAVARIIESEITPRLIGRPAGSPASCWQLMDQVTHRGGRDTRTAIRAVGAVDTAIWDLFAKSLGVPLYRLWGGYRDTLPIVAIAGYHGSDPAAMAAEMVELKELGIGGCKVKVGGDPVLDAERVRSARVAAGDDFHLFADANRGWTRAQALEFCSRIRDVGIVWLEEPCHWRNARRDNRDVRLMTGIPVCAGQSETSGEGCRDLIADGAIDVCNYDASWSAGPTEWLRVAGLAAAYGVQMAHHGEPHLGAHLLGAIPHGTFVETHHPDRDPIFHGMMLTRPTFKNGTCRIPAGAGWGIELDWDALTPYRLN